MRKVAVIIFSGGLDSYTLLKNLQTKPDLEIHALSVNYGQRHAKELEYAKKVCEEEGLPHKVINLEGLKSALFASSLTSNEKIPHGHYEDETMKQTVVPNRNAILLMIAAGYAISIGASQIYVGVHTGDHAIYPDCRPEFIEAINKVLAIANYVPIKVIAPYIYHSKIEIAEIGLALNLDYGKAWTCYEGNEKACGKCGACQERLEAIKLSGATDTMEYEK